MEKIKFSKTDIEKHYKELVEKYGNNGSFYVYDYSFHYDLELEGLIVEQIKIFNGEIVFSIYDNDNEDDYVYLNKPYCSVEELIKFYNDLLDAIKDKTKKK